MMYYAGRWAEDDYHSQKGKRQSRGRLGRLQRLQLGLAGIGDPQAGKKDKQGKHLEKRSEVSGATAS